MNDVVQIRKNTETVKALEEMLDMARRGELIGFAATYITHDGSLDGFTGIQDYFTEVIAGMRVLEHRIISAYANIPEGES